MVDSPTDPDGDGVANNGGLDTQPAAFGGLPAPGAAVALTSKVYLGAVYNDVTGLMSDNLRAAALIPLNQPYGGTEYTDFAYNGTETTTAPVLAVTGNNAIVDWVLVELHNAVNPITIVARRAALVQRDGDVVDVDGVSPLTFSSASSGNYYVSVRHRNHIGVMTQNTVAMSPVAVTVDFTVAATGNYQLSGPTGTPHAQQVWGSTKRSLWAGNMTNVSSTGDKIIYQGANSDIEATYFKVLLEPGNTLFLSNYIVANVYARTDANMNGNVIYQGANADPDVPFFTVSLYPANTLFLPNYVVFEQIPK